MRIHFTSGYHPEADGQTERVNQTLKQYLWMYINFQQDNWSTLLSLAEFAYNNTPHTTTGISPFYANKGYNLVISIHSDRDITSARAWDFVTNLDELHQVLWENISEAQKHYQGC